MSLSAHITLDEYFDLFDSLEEHHFLFMEFWRLGFPTFTDQIETAGVGFSKAGDFVSFLFGQKFWDECSEYKRKFVIAHECLHVLLNHGFRGKDLQPDIANIAMDVVINEFLINTFDFDREKVEGWDKYCFIDTIFTNKGIFALKGQNFEYYYNLIMKYASCTHDVILVDDHGGLGSLTGEQMDTIADQLSGKMSQKELDDLKDRLKSDFGKGDKDSHEFNKINPQGNKEGGKQAGTGAGNALMKIKPVRKYNRRWESVIFQWAREYEEDDIDSFTREPRRMQAMMNDFCGGFVLPGIAGKPRKGRVKLWAFQDTSGSCVHLAERFFKAVNSIPPDRFDVRTFCFDTQVYPVKNGELKGFGGTTFTCIDEYIRRHIKEKPGDAPDAVFVITDGYGNNVNPEFPKKWYWFLSEDYTSCIPKECKTFSLKNFE